MIDAIAKVMLAAVVSCSLTLCGCVNANDARAQADAATARFHEQFNSRDFAAIHAAAGPEFKKASTAPQLEASLESYRSQLGPFQRLVQSNEWVLSRTSTGSLITMTHESAFANGYAREAFAWRVEGTNATLVKYTLDNLVTETETPVVTAQRTARPVRLIPIQALPAHLLHLRRYYRERLGLDVELLPALIPDRAAWAPERRQWAAEGLAEQVRQSVANDDAIVIGVTGEDIYLRNANWRFAFGLRLDKRVAIVSYARMDPRFFNQPESMDVLHRRLQRMVTKDLGLMLFGLEASLDPASPMARDIGGIAELDAMGDDLAGAGFPVVTR
jgi:predicted Zn-dependent protease